MLWPTIILDNFFDNPEKIVEFANSLEFKKDLEGRYPGKRTDLLHTINKNFFDFFAKKVVSVLYPINYLEANYNLSLTFQKISNDHINKGWVHTDNMAAITVIVYLSKHKECGTSIFECKNAIPTNKNSDKKKEIYLSKDFKNEKRFLNENNDQFEETISIKPRFNRIIIFDSSNHHAAQKFKEDSINEDRLTLIGFFYYLNFAGIKYPGIQHQRII